MNIIEKIINESNDEIRNKIIKERIMLLESESLQNQVLDVNSIYHGFISSSSEIEFSTYGIDANLGLMDKYGMKQQDYIYEFFNYLKDNNISNINAVINSISPFLRTYFGVKNNNTYNRGITFENMQKQLLEIYKKDNENFEKYRNKWLDIGIFKNNSMAECTEYSAISQNLLAFLGFDTYYLSGHLSTSKIDEDHAFNLVKTPTGNYFLIDSTNPIGLYDDKLNIITTKTRFFQISKEQYENAISGNGLNLEIKTCHYQRKDGRDRVIDIDVWKYSIKGKRKTL